MKRLLAILFVLAFVAAALGFYFHQRHLRELGNTAAPSVSQARTAKGANTSGHRSELVQQLPAGASAILYVDVAALRVSPFSEALAALAPTESQDPEYARFVRATGFDYSRDLDRVALALWPRESATSVVALAEGRFDRQKITHYAIRTGRRVKQGGHEIFEVPERGSPRTIRFTFLAPNEMALADGPGLSAVLEPASSSRLDSAMRQRLAKVAGSSIFAVARNQDLAKDMGIDETHSAQLSRLLRSVQNLTFTGQPDGSNLHLTLDAESDSTLDAIELASVLDGLRWVGRAALKDPKTEQQIGPQGAALDSLLRVTEISHHGRWVRLQSSVTPGMLVEAGRPSPEAAPAGPSKR